MSTAIRSPLLQLAPRGPGTGVRLENPASAPAGAGGARFSTLDWIFAEQQDLTAVERFARKHDDAALPANARFYRDLIPAKLPGADQQYAFEVDLDLCTGCKACVTGCHNLNGLDDDEVWRTVGVLHGGNARSPVQQTVTTACHHCLEPACLEGCPVKAYEKDPVTGIVKHLDDQCIGCQYCVFMCPYDAPKYNKARGIVRKCDMCSDRLAHGEAPACVQSCPNEAIRITVVDRGEAIQATESNAFLPGTPAPSDTLPTTVYKTERALPRNMLPADFYSVSPEHAHPPLVAMLGLTQLSVGAFVLNLLSADIVGPLGAGGLEGTNAVFALALGLAALGASTLHLGRPRYAFRAMLGLRTSWLSREILAFSLFAALAAVFAGSFFLPTSFPIWHGPLLVPPSVRSALGMAGGAAGVGGVFCSVMVYAATKRAHWRASVTGFKFTLATVILGAATVIMVSTIASVHTGGAPPFYAAGAYRLLTRVLLVAGAVKLSSEAATLRHVRDPHHSVLKRMALLLTGELRAHTIARFLCGSVGALLLPALGLVILRLQGASGAAPHGLGLGLAASEDFPSLLLAIVAAFQFACCLAGELLERYLFFAAAPASKMPGTIA